MKSGIYKLQSFGIIFIGAMTLLSGCSNNPLVGATSKVSSEQSASNWQESVNELNEKITILSRWQQGYRMTAQQAQFKADRIQFQQENLVDSKRLWKVAENASQKAQDLQVIIDKLVQQRNSILQKHNQPIPKGSGYENKNSIEEQEL